MKRTPLKRKLPLKRSRFKRKPMSNELKKSNADWREAVDQNTGGQCLLSLTDPEHKCRGQGDRTRMEHHHVLTKGAHPAHKHNVLNGVCACPIAHDIFHDKGLDFVVRQIYKAGIKDVLTFVCEVKGIDMRTIEKVEQEDVEIFVKSTKSPMGLFLATLEVGKSLFITCPDIEAEKKALRSLIFYHQSRRDDNVRFSTNMGVNPKSNEHGALVTCHEK